MKRSNRLVLLVGVFLAIVAFVGILVLQGGPEPVDPDLPPTELPTVIATQDIPLGTAIRADQVKVETKAVVARDTDAFGDVSQVVGKIVRQQVVTGAAITAKTLTGDQPGQIREILCPPTKRCVSVQVDQVSGVGTIIKTGDYVDMVVGFDLAGGEATAASVNSETVKLLLQGMQVMGTLLPPTPAAAQPAASGAPAAEPGTVLTGQQEIVILAVTAQQAEVIKFSQLEAKQPPSGITLLLRSPTDFIDPVTGLPFENGPIPDATTGIIFKNLVDDYLILPPEIVEIIRPETTPAP